MHTLQYTRLHYTALSQGRFDCFAFILAWLNPSASLGDVSRPMHRRFCNTKKSTRAHTGVL